MFPQYGIPALMLITSVMGAPTQCQTRRSCSAIHLIHASGTFEEPGLGALGTPLSSALADSIPGTTSYGIPYNTSAEFNQTLAEGAAMIITYLRGQVDRCPDQQFVLSGLSKGVMVIHSTKLDSELTRKILVILAFGDPWRNDRRFNTSWPIDLPSVDLSPRDGSASVENVISFCNSGDTVCETGGADPNALPPAHLTYPVDGSIGVAVDFIKVKLQSN